MPVTRSLAFALCTVLLLLAALGAPGAGTPGALAAPVNDNFANAIAITTPSGAPGIVAVGDSTGAGTDEVDENNPTCQGSTGSTIWYTWTPGTSGTAVLDVWGSGISDTVLGVYTGSAFPLTEVACSDDAFAVGGGLLSALSFSYAASTTYRIQVGGYNAASGPVVLNMSLGAAIYINDNGSFDTPDSNIDTLEAVRFASGTLGRVLQAGEAARVLNAGAAGVSGADLIHYSPVAFPVSGPAVFGPGIIPVTIADLSATNDTLSAVGAGVIVDGQNTAIVSSCLTVSGTGNHVEGLQVRACVVGIAVAGGGNVLGGSLIPAQRNVIYSNTTSTGAGAIVAGSSNQVIGNFFGTNTAGTAALANDVGVYVQGSGNMVGGGLADQGNLFSGNNSAGIVIQGGSGGHVVKGNRIGTDVTGTYAIPNVGAALFIDRPTNTIGGAAAGEGNLISGNVNQAIYLSGASTSGNVIKGNRIGVNAAGTSPLPNGSGLTIASAPGNIIGGLLPGEGNLIAYSTTGDGVRVEGAAGTGNLLRGNSIHSNSGVGINNASGGNTELSPPNVTSVTSGQVQGLACPNCTVDIYNDDADEGRTYLASATANGAGAFAATISGYTLGFITATATDSGANTSEFSSAFAAPPNADGDGLPDSVDGCPNTPEDYDQWDDGDGCPDSDNDSDGICDPGQASVSCAGSDSGKYCFDPAATLACHIAPASDCRNVAEDYDNFKDTDGCPEPDNDNDGFQDFADNCPGSAAAVGADGMLGSPQDLNHNGVSNGAEGPLTTDDVVKTFEDYDAVLDNDGCHDSPGADFDSDGYTDEAEAGTLFCGNGQNNDPADDAVVDDGCPNGPAAAGVFSEGQLRIGTDAGYPCGGNSWPSDLVSTGGSMNKLDILDIVSFIGPVRRLDKSPPNAAYSPRWDLAPGPTTPFPNHINIVDITTLMNGVPGGPAYPPMLGGLRAFDRVCPLAPQ